ncbi:hypothetical protein ACH5RR_023276 [Cinchona calisaya]|uniref:Uncharacterized protein n=1 Tax=Cinchona calisaya TaxID=153742 RepID=A0ABD2ZA76_9GENT
MGNGEVALIKLRHHEKGPRLRKRLAEEDKSKDAPHLVERERVKLEAKAKMTLQKLFHGILARARPPTWLSIVSVGLNPAKDDRGIKEGQALLLCTDMGRESTPLNPASNGYGSYASRLMWTKCLFFNILNRCEWKGRVPVKALSDLFEDPLFDGSGVGSLEHRTRSFFMRALPLLDLEDEPLFPPIGDDLEKASAASEMKNRSSRSKRDERGEDRRYWYLLFLSLGFQMDFQVM